jgi:soluble lytic murein transglycosylase-like protein
MRIDPSLIKQMLQLQMLQGLESFQGPQTGLGITSTGSEFSELLESLLSETSAASAGKVIPASELLARGTRVSSFPIGPAGNTIFNQASSPTDYETYIEASGKRHGVDTSLVKAVIQAESDFDATAVSKAGAKGLMQLMDSTGQGLGVRDPFDPQQNIEGGTRFLSNLLKKYNGNEGAALAAYNAGPGRVDRLGIRNDADLEDKLRLLPKETQNYVSKVLGLKQQFQA